MILIIQTIVMNQLMIQQCRGVEKWLKKWIEMLQVDMMYEQDRLEKIKSYICDIIDEK